MAKSNNCELIQLPDKIIIGADYNEGFVEQLKYLVVPQSRTWNSETKLWEVLNLEYLPDLKILAKKYYNHAYLKYKDKTGCDMLERLHTGEIERQSNLFG